MKVIKDGKDIAVSVCPHCKKEVQISKYDWEELKAHLIGEKEKLEGVFMALCDQRNDEQCLEVLRRWKAQIIEENCKCTVCKKCKATFCYSCAEKSDFGV